MTDKIQEAQKLIQQNKKGKVNISGKDYSTVPARVESFRRVIKTEDVPAIPAIYTHVVAEGDTVTARAYLAQNIEIIINDDGRECEKMDNVVSVGTAEEVLNAQKTGNVVELRNRAGSKMKQFQSTYSSKKTQKEVNDYLIEKREFIDWLKENDPEGHRVTMKQVNDFKSTLPQE